jgi:hypothetical protein
MVIWFILRSFGVFLPFRNVVPRKIRQPRSRSSSHFKCWTRVSLFSSDFFLTRGQKVIFVRPSVFDRQQADDPESWFLVKDSAQSCHFFPPLATDHPTSIRVQFKVGQKKVENGSELRIPPTICCNEERKKKERKKNLFSPKKCRTSFLRGVQPLQRNRLMP